MVTGRVQIERHLDFRAVSCTGSVRFKPTPPAKLAERREKHRTQYGPKYRATHLEQERERARKCSAKRRRERPDQTKAANREWYARNREAVLQQKREYYLRTKAGRKAGAR